MGRDADAYFRSALAAAFLAGALENTVVVAPRFASNESDRCRDGLAPNELNWVCIGAASWRDGAPAIGHGQITSYDILDEILKRVTRAGYILPRPAEPPPPFGAFTDAGCTNYDNWPYGLQHRIGYSARLTDAQLKSQLSARPLIYVLGELDIQVQFYAATSWDQDVKAVVCTGMFANLPWKSRHLLVQDEQNWKELLEAAMQSLREGKDADVMPVRMFWISGEKVPMTGRHFLTYRAENSSVADGTYWIRRVPYPVLLVRDEGDVIIQPFEPYMLLSAATTPGSLVPAIKYVMLGNKTRGPAEHGFVSNRDTLVETVAGWLAERGLK